MTDLVEGGKVEVVDGIVVGGLVAVGLVFNADGVKDILLELFNKIIGA